MRRSHLLILAVGLVASGTENRAAVYYVATNGSDSNNGLSTGSPFQSLARVNGLSLLPGDQLMFRRGDTFRGQLNVAQSGTSGNPIVVDAYGTGNLPILSGTTLVTNWT